MIVRRRLLLLLLVALLLSGCGSADAEDAVPSETGPAAEPGLLDVNRVRFEDGTGKIWVWGESRLDPGTPLKLTLGLHQDADAPTLAAEAAVGQGGRCGTSGAERQGRGDGQGSA